MQTIGLQQMLRNIERVNADGSPHVFTILVVRAANNKRAGTLAEIMCSKLGHGAGHSHKRLGTLPLWNVKKQQVCTPVLDNILFYNGQKVLW